MSDRPHICGHPTTGSRITIIFRRASLVVWPLTAVLLITTDLFSRINILGLVATLVCTLTLLLNVPELTYVSLVPPRNYNDIRHDSLARSVFIGISTILIPLYAAGLYETVYIKYGSLDEFNALPYALQAGVLWGLYKFLCMIHKLVGSISISIAFWYSRCFQPHLPSPSQRSVELRKRSRSEDGEEEDGAAVAIRLQPTPSAIITPTTSVQSPP